MNQDFLKESSKNVSRSNFTCGEVQKRVAHKSNICASTNDGKYVSVDSFVASRAHFTAVERKEKVKPLVGWSYATK